MKFNVFVLLVIMMCVIMISGCQTSKALCDDIASTAAWTSDKLTPLVDKQKANDAEIQAKWLMRYQAEQVAAKSLVTKSQEK